MQSCPLPSPLSPWPRHSVPAGLTVLPSLARAVPCLCSRKTLLRLRARTYRSLPQDVFPTTPPGRSLSKLTT